MCKNYNIKFWGVPPASSSLPRAPIKYASRSASSSADFKDFAAAVVSAEGLARTETPAKVLESSSALAASISASSSAFAFAAARSAALASNLHAQEADYIDSSVSEFIFEYRLSWQFTNWFG